MATYNIHNYLKLLCLRMDHFETIIEDELNTIDDYEIEGFIDKYKDKQGLKIIIIEMNTEEIITFDDVQKIIHNAHVFDYMRQLISDGHKLLSIEDMKNASIDSFIKYMLEAK